MNITFSFIPRVHPFCCQGLSADQGSSLPDQESDPELPRQSAGAEGQEQPREGGQELLAAYFSCPYNNHKGTPGLTSHGRLVKMKMRKAFE